MESVWNVDGAVCRSVVGRMGAWSPLCLYLSLPHLSKRCCFQSRGHGAMQDSRSAPLVTTGGTAARRGKGGEGRKTQAATSASPDSRLSWHQCPRALAQPRATAPRHKGLSITHRFMSSI